MDYAGAAGRGLTVNGAVAAAGTTMFDAVAIWTVMAVLMFAIGIAMVMISSRRNRLDAVAVGIRSQSLRRNNWLRRK